MQGEPGTAHGGREGAGAQRPDRRPAKAGQRPRSPRRGRELRTEGRGRNDAQPASQRAMRGRRARAASSVNAQSAPVWVLGKTAVRVCGASRLRDGRSAGRRERGGVTGRRRRQESKRRLLLRGADRAATGVARTNRAICESGRIINLQSTLTDLAADALKPSHLKTRGECRKSGILAESAVIS